MSELSAAPKRAQRFTLSTSFNFPGRNVPSSLNLAPRSFDQEPCFLGDYEGPLSGGTTAPSAYNICRMGHRPALLLRSLGCSSILWGDPMASGRARWRRPTKKAY